MREGWEYKKLGEVCFIERGGSPRPIQQYITDEANGLNWIKIGDAVEGCKYIYSTKEKIKPEGLKKTRFVHKGDFILSNSMSFGKPYILGIDGCIHDGWLVIRDNNTTFDKSFLYYVLSSTNINLEFKRLAVGGVVNNLNSNLVRSVIVPIPPLKEQERIVSELDLLSSIIEKKKAQLKEYDQLAQSIFYDMFGDPVTNEKGWEVRDIKTICSKVTDGTHDTPQRINKGVKFITGKHIRPFFIDYENSDYVAEEVHKEIFLRCNPEFGDVLYTNIGAGIGNAAINTVKYEFSMKNVALLKIKKNVVDGHFIEFYLNYEKTKSKIIDNFSNGGAQRFLSLKAISKIPVHVPPIKLQHFFAAKIESLEHQKSLIKQSITEMETLFNSRMDYWFS